MSLIMNSATTLCTNNVCTDAVCSVNNQCLQPTTASANTDYDNCRPSYGCKINPPVACNGRVTGDLCDPGCLDGYHKQTGSPFSLICEANGDYNDLSSTACLPNDCSNGAISPSLFVDYSPCTVLTTGLTCTPVCNEGYTGTAMSAITLSCMGLGGNPGYYFDDTSGISCTANTCANGPAGAVDANSDFTSCLTLSTGGTCNPLCKPGYTKTRGVTFTVVCSAGSTFPDGSNIVCTPGTCSGGPRSSTTFVDYTSCNVLKTGETCTPVCESGYTGTATGFTLECLVGKYDDMSALACTPESCTGPETAGVQVNYTECVTSKVTGQSCTPTCNEGYRVATGVSFNLVCPAGIFKDLSGTVCQPSACSRGPKVAADGVDYSSCNSMVTSQTCTPSCLIGFSEMTAPTPFVLLCDPLLGYDDTSGIACSPSPCTAGPITPIPGVDYSTCTSQTSGQSCMPSCDPGAVQLSGSSFTLSCDVNEQFIDLSGIRCVVDFDECGTTCLSGCPNGTAFCNQFNQLCIDSNITVRGDWTCNCVDPAVGTSATASAANCIFDECLRYEATCTAVGQTCSDPNTLPTSLNDWACDCVAANGTATAKPATCDFEGECQQFSSSCTSNGQTCFDPNVTNSGDWQCLCVAPMTGVAGQMAPATCAIDECIDNGPTCAAVGQSCVDKNTHPNSRNDWSCQCPSPLTGSALGVPANCILDECIDNVKTCSAAGQTCIDPDKNSTSTGNWMCTCVNSVGQATAAVATCDFPGECKPYSSTCTTVGQTCRDPSSAMGDWVCECLYPQVGADVIAAPATCIFDECATAAAQVCSSNGQLCKDADTDPNSIDNWSCVCPDPSTGEQLTGLAACTFDECITNSQACSGAGQTCSDKDTSTLSTGDWQCNCVPPAVGSAVGRTASCVYDGECSPYSSICTSKGQTCVDPSTSSFDWQCHCVSPQTGSPGINEPATCILDECLVYDVCQKASQSCVDKNTSPDSKGDWECICVAPSVGKAVAGVAICSVDECIDNAVTCSKVGQLCNDPNTNPLSVDDWTCSCVAPATGSAVATPATCTHQGECVPYSSVCTSQGQSCSDPHQGTADWICSCVLPAVGEPRIADPADCSLDECQFGIKCPTGQSCRDTNTNPLSTGDWMCLCDEPSVGSQLGGGATCTLDECTIHDGTCSASGQTCRDPDTSTQSLNDWICECVPPSNGSSIASTATCIFDGECSAYSTTCTTAGQTCIDNSPAFGDWECVCVQPRTGSPAVMKAATCILDECTLYGTICTNAGQICVDPNVSPSLVNDWECRCTGGTTGQSIASVASCVNDECMQANISKICSDVGQLCEDIDQRPSSLGDWSCRCPFPAQGSGQAAPAVCIFAGECRNNSALCTTSGQTCEDPFPTPGDWQCACVSPTVGNPSTMGVAQCVLDECTQTCATCSMGVCSDANQECVDLNPSQDSLSDWECRCISPTTGSARGTVAACIRDECKLQGTVCTSAGQTCEDPDTSITSLHDWSCSCVPPAVGTSIGTTASCNYTGECTIQSPICTAEGQFCEDLDPSTPGNWQCKCPPPQQGTPTNLQPAQCTLDECLAICPTCADSGGGNVCSGAQQSCNDPNQSPSSTNDWSCICAPPLSNVSSVGAVAECVLDECASFGSVCAAAGQTCRDTNTEPQASNDWVCECVAPAVGTASGKVAICQFVGECVPYSGICTSVGQTCNDPSNNVGDWQCECVSPLTGSVAVAKPTSCELDECTAACPTCANKGTGNICTAAGQVCREGSTDAQSTSDWSCYCVSPLEGSKVNGPADCIRDECQEHLPLCASVGQFCTDTNTSPSSLNDWQCECYPPAVGMSATSIATCTYTGECVPYSDQCTRFGQTCEDPSAAVGDWVCKCVTPQVGSPEQGKPANCTHDECNLNTVCTAAGQVCIDANLSPVSLGDWQCSCVIPAVGVATGKPAVCGLEECQGKGAICAAAGQECIDPDPFTSDNWICKCAAPSVGEALTAVANCVLDECILNRTTCTDVGQTCTDPNTNPLNINDWQCSCSDGSATAYGAPAPCPYDECLYQSSICTTAAQSCRDLVNLTTSLGDWQCQCVHPYVGSAIAQPANCTLDECVINGGFCTAFGQDCVDSDRTTVGTWQCLCRSPLTGTPQTGSAAVCVLDECITNGDICINSGQLCEDPNTSPTSPSDWFCKCPPPLSGETPGGPATCLINECTESCSSCAGSTCSAAGQVCVDEDFLVYANWKCECVAPNVGFPGLMKAATCELNECTTDCGSCAGTVCGSNQICRDYNTSQHSTSDWVCECTGDLQGTAVASRAICTLDECQTFGDVCWSRGQSCTDPSTNPLTLNDWFCTCVPGTVTQVGGPANCTYSGECSTNYTTCTSAGQTCIDPNPVVDNWQCACVAPSRGVPKVRGVTDCEYDECKEECKGCADTGAGNMCEMAGQTCVDDNPVLSSLNDWSCVCVSPSRGSLRGAVATCEVDECGTYADTCNSVGQACNDPSKISPGDWQCVCVSPNFGSATAGPASCNNTGECATKAPFCATKKQSCADPNGSTNSQGDWECRCISPFTGSAVATHATCVLDECLDDNNNRICSDAGQTCNDPNTDPNAVGDWECICASPSTGKQRAGAAENCILDECISNRMTCFYSSQACVDTNTSSTSLGDWQCNCLNSDGFQTGGPATCSSQKGECSAFSTTCLAATQSCFDPDTSNNSTGDWECRCVPPSTGTAGSSLPGTCVINECDYVKCGEQQVCDDPDTSSASIRDYTCTCIGELRGKEVGKPVASCFIGECQDNTCPIGQTCEEGSSSKGDFKCVCPFGQTGSATGMGAVCTIDECKNVTCGANQRCVDPNMSPSSIGDWSCCCVEPWAGGCQAVGRSSCYENDCAKGVSNRTCTDVDQVCVDPSPAAGDWTCECRLPLIGTEVNGVADCGIDECYNNDACENQTCNDPNTTLSSVDDWTCNCNDPGTHGAAVGRVAFCLDVTSPPQPAAPDDGVTSNWWFWVLVIAGVLCCGFIFYAACKKRDDKDDKKDDPPKPSPGDGAGSVPPGGPDYEPYNKSDNPAGVFIAPPPIDDPPDSPPILGPPAVEGGKVYTNPDTTVPATATATAAPIFDTVRKDNLQQEAAVTTNTLSPNSEAALRERIDNLERQLLASQLQPPIADAGSAPAAAAAAEPVVPIREDSSFIKPPSSKGKSKNSAVLEELHSLIMNGNHDLDIDHGSGPNSGPNWNDFDSALPPSRGPSYTSSGVNHAAASYSPNSRSQQPHFSEFDI
eukprot:TRINITY_DN2614_c1_g4_i3.p1 TRINITY_DN2614_c1_g4~~TRINITY_DN2614_c1_g4_i3.p1  ORF type:complete len:3253 (+),score=710.66 TRINITY_DN2614_c1_g4_i3:479-10237(+)